MICENGKNKGRQSQRKGNKGRCGGRDNNKEKQYNTKLDANARSSKSANVENTNIPKTEQLSRICTVLTIYRVQNAIIIIITLREIIAQH